MKINFEKRRIDWILSSALIGRRIKVWIYKKENYENVCISKYDEDGSGVETVCEIVDVKIGKNLYPITLELHDNGRIFFVNRIRFDYYLQFVNETQD